MCTQYCNILSYCYLTHWQTIHIFYFCLTQGSTGKLTKDAKKESSSGDNTAMALDVGAGPSSAPTHNAGAHQQQATMASFFNNPLIQGLMTFMGNAAMMGQVGTPGFGTQLQNPVMGNYHGFNHPIPQNTPKDASSGEKKKARKKNKRK